MKCRATSLAKNVIYLRDITMQRSSSNKQTDNHAYSMKQDAKDADRSWILGVLNNSVETPLMLLKGHPFYDRLMI